MATQEKNPGTGTKKKKKSSAKPGKDSKAKKPQKSASKKKKKAKQGKPPPSPFARLRPAIEKRLEPYRRPFRLPAPDIYDGVTRPPPPRPRIAGRQRVLIVLPAGIQVFRFVHTGAFARLEANADVDYLLPPSGTRHEIAMDHSMLPAGHTGEVAINRWRYQIYRKLAEASLYALARKCASFRVRDRMNMQTLRSRMPRLAYALYRARIIFLSLPGILPFVRRQQVKKAGPNPQMLEVLRQGQYDIVLIPSSLLDAVTNDTIIAADRLNIPTLLLQTSWDNLSSKGVIISPPTWMGVWSEQSERHAVDYQLMTKDHVRVLGSAYYEPFFHGKTPERQAARTRLGMPEEGRVVLFGGSFRQFDETAFLRTIESAIGDGRLPPMTVFYRPHPGRELRDEEMFFDHTWKHVMMDPEVEEVYRANAEGRMVSQNEFAYSLERLGDIYSAIDAAISPMSSLVLEALIFGKPVLCLGYNDGRNRWGPDQTSQMTHFMEIKTTPAVRVAETPASVIPLLDEILRLAADPDTAEKARQSTDYFVRKTEPDYATMLSELVDEITGSGPTA